MAARVGGSDTMDGDPALHSDDPPPPRMRQTRLGQVDPGGGDHAHAGGTRAGWRD